MNRTIAAHRVALAVGLALLTITSMGSCGSGPESQPEPASTTNSKPLTAKGSKLFKLLDAEATGVDFINVLDENSKVNFYAWDYLYNGGGVAVGDLNNDGLPDLYFTGTISPDKLYLNKGNLQFEDITEKAGVAGHKGLKTGVNMTDVNADGLLDIYVCRSGFPEDKALHANLLFINKGNMQFEEQAASYGLAEMGNSVHSAFFDYDRDGDLDCYVANHPGFRLKYKEVFAGMQNPSEQVRDKFFINNDGHFTESSRQVGIVNWGHGLGLNVNDYDNDGYPDIYVANDFQAPDFFYQNNGDGTFTEQLKSAFPHCSYFSMGTDAADLNNDGRLDLFVVEMLAKDNKRKKTNMAPMNADRFWNQVKAGWHYQYMRNVLQINNGPKPGNTRGAIFSDAADLAGLRNTDWSWAPLFADFDNDGHTDLIVTNGYLRDTQDKDYINKTDAIAAQRGGSLDYSEVAPLMKQTRLPNFAFQGSNSLQFEDVSTDWGFDFAGFSHGAAYGDLDGDGDLDVVVNNFVDPACVYENTANSTRDANYLRIKFAGPPGNQTGLGSKVTLHTSNGKRYQELQTVHGFQGSMEPILHFGLAAKETIERLEIEWADGMSQTLKAPKTNQLLTVSHSETTDYNVVVSTPPSGLFREVGSAKGAIFTHTENEFDDYEREILLPHKQSQHGPHLAVGDINNDGLQDFYVGGAAGQPGTLLIEDGPLNLKTVSTQTWQAAAAHEDVAAHFFDADGDGDQDLYVVSGGNEFAQTSPLLQDRLYINKGNGAFGLNPNALPDMPTSGGCAVSADYDGDGDLDLFVGGRVLPGKYPFAPRSYVLQNNGGTFTDVTASVAPELQSPGLIAEAVWTDYNSDGRPDLMLGGEWTAPMLFENVGGKLENRTEALGLDKHVGWWFSITEADLDGDGDPDYVLGNLGKNYKYRATAEEPFHVYCDDFDESGSFDIVLGYYNDGQCFPVRGRQCSSEQMPFIKKKFPTYEAFGEASLNDVYGESLDEALHYEATDFGSAVLMNNNGKLEWKPLPEGAQLAPIMGSVASDLNRDGHVDLFVAGNLFVAEVETPRADAGTGLILAGDGAGNFTPMSIQESGILANRDVRDVAILNAGPGNPRLIVVANNNSGLQLFLENAR